MLDALSNQLRALPTDIQGAFGGKYSLNLPAVARNLNKIAVPALVLFGLSYIQGASAGPIAYATCISGCELSFTQAGIIFAPSTGGGSLLAILSGPLACPAICLPVLGAPTP